MSTLLRLLVIASSVGACGSDEVIPGVADAAVDGGSAIADAARDGAPRDADIPETCLPVEGAGETLVSLLEDPPYLVGNPTGLTCVTDAVRGGTGPHTCSFYVGPARGTVPAGVMQDTGDPSGCTLVGGVDTDSGDRPGAYGFTMVVEDALGDTVEIPVAYQGPACDTATAIITPDAWPVIVHAPGTARNWQLNITDLDGVEQGMVCDACNTLSLLTRGPLTIAAGLDCANPGDVCSDCADCVTFIGACPGESVATMTRFVNLAAHAPLRNEGLAGWVTIDFGVSYSGISFDPCAGKSWGCHIEVLEVP